MQVSVQVPHQVQVLVQQVDSAITDPDLRWTTIAQPEPLTYRRSGARSEWTGEVEVPIDGGDVRVLVEELEPVVTDDGTDDGADRADLTWMEVVEVPRPRR